MITIDENDQGKWIIYSNGVKVDVFDTLREAQADCIQNHWTIDKINWNAKVTENWGLKKK